MSHPFLSDEWIAQARAIRARVAPDRMPIIQVVRVNVVVTGVPFGEGTVESYIDTSSGDVLLDLGQLDDPDVSLTTDYDTAKAIFVTQDPAAGMQAFMAGKVVVQGDMMKLMMLQTVGGSGPAAKQIADEIQAMTSN